MVRWEDGCGNKKESKGVEAATLEDAKKLAARLRHPEYYIDACDEAADEIVKMADTIATLQADAKEYRKRLNQCGGYRP